MHLYVVEILDGDRGPLLFPIGLGQAGSAGFG
jgi:hypothetical protein